MTINVGLMGKSVALRQDFSKLLHSSPVNIILTKFNIHMNSTSIDTFHAVKLTESLNKPQTIHYSVLD